MNWFQRNFKTIIYVSFLVPILTVAFVSISHVTKWYGLSNPVSWAIYLSVGIEIAALSALAAISAKMGKKVYFPFGIVTLIQFIGNIFFAYQYIDVNSESFKDWVDLVDPIVGFLGVDSGDPVGHKRFLALFAGGMLPIISLSFLHMLVKFEEEEKKNGETLIKDIDLLSTEAGKKESEFVEEKLNPSEEELLKIIEEHSIFLHPSELEAGHPNLTLLESISCRVPVVGTYDGNHKIEGLYKVERSTESVKKGILEVIENYAHYMINTEIDRKYYDWSTVCTRLLNMYGDVLKIQKEYTSDITKNLFIKAFN